MTPTGVFVTAEEMQEIRKLMQPTISIDLKRHQNTVEQGPGRAMARLAEIAAAKGLPPLEPPKGYGLASNLEIIAP